MSLGSDIQNKTSRLSKIQFKEGAKLEARDHLGDRWWEAKVVEVDPGCSEVLVHFIGWNDRHDEWIKMDSPRLQPATRKTRRSGNGSEGGGQAGPSSSPKDFKTGDEVMATWNKIKYPAKILSFEADGSYMIQYYDGVKKRMRSNGLRRISVEDQPFIKSVKLDLEELLAQEPLNGSSDGRRSRNSSGQPEEKGRRRKSKFNVKEIFNISDKKPTESDGKKRAESPAPLRDKGAESPAPFSDRKTGKVSLATDLLESNTRSDSIFELDSSNKNLPKSDFKNPGGLPVVGPGGDCQDFKRPTGERRNGEEAGGANKEGMGEDNYSKNSPKENNVNENSDTERTRNCDITPCSSPTTPIPVTNGMVAAAEEFLDQFLPRQTSESQPTESSESVGDTGSEGTPSEKENLPSGNINNTKEEKSSVRIRKSSKDNLPPTDGLGKRSRKRKRWPDEDPETGRKKTASGGRSLPELNTSIAKSKPNRVMKVRGEGVTPKSAVLSPKKKNSSEPPVKPLPDPTKPEQTSPKPVLNNNIKPTTTTTTTSDSTDSFPYLNFDFSLPHSELLASVVEGFNVPAVGKPIRMKAPQMPPRWKKMAYVRKNGLSAGKWDVYLVAPEKKTFRSKMDLGRYFETNKLELSVENFDFVLDPPLKKIRNIWRLHLQELKGTTASPVPSLPEVDEKEEGGSVLYPLANNIPYELMGVIPSTPAPTTPTTNGFSLSQKSSKSSKVESEKSSRSPKAGSEKSTKSPKKESESSSKSPKESPLKSPKDSSSKSPKDAESRLLTPGGTASASLPGHSPGLERGVRCNLANCNKLFRNEKLLLCHVKHYHSHLENILAESIGNSPTVTDMAYLNTRVGDKTKDLLETEGELLEILKKAEKKFERLTAARTPRSSRAIGRQPARSTVTPPSRPTERLKKKKNSPIEKPEKKCRTPEEELEVKTKHLSETPKPEIIASTTPLPSPSPAPDLPTPLAKGVALPSTPLTSDVKRVKSRIKRSSLHESLQIEAGEIKTPTAAPEEPPKKVIIVTPPSSSPALTAETLAAAGGSTPPTWKRRPVRTPPEEGVEMMTEEEVVHCVCGRGEGDGLMVQCDVCLTWQHGLCLEIYTEEQVPEKYICATCQHPRLGRQSALYRTPQYWLLQGALPSLGPPQAPEDRLGALTSLMADLTSLSGLLHSLQLKLHIAEQANHPKVFMWSAPWESPPSTSPDLPWEDSSFLNLDLPFGDSDLPPGEADLVTGDADLVPDDTMLVPGDAELVPEDADIVPGDADLVPGDADLVPGDADLVPGDADLVPGDADLVHGDADLVPGDADLVPGDADLVPGDAELVPGDEELEDPDDSNLRSEPVEPKSGGSDPDKPMDVGSGGQTFDSGQNFDSDGQAFSSGSQTFDNTAQPFTSEQSSFNKPLAALAGFDKTDEFSFFDIPSLSEVQQLLPGVLKELTLEPPTPANNQLPEAPKLIDREESKANLLQHVEHIQNLIDERLNAIETAVVAEETANPTAVVAEETANPTAVDEGSTAGNCWRINKGLHRLLQDLRSIKKATNLMPEKL